jgi:hypothetical protein
MGVKPGNVIVLIFQPGGIPDGGVGSSERSPLRSPPVDLIFALVLLSVAVAPLALLSGWLAGRGSRPLGALVNSSGSEAWWRSTMPWPRGVQEEDDVTWSFRGSQQPTSSWSATTPTTLDEADEVRIEPTHLRPRVRRR